VIVLLFLTIVVGLGYFAPTIVAFSRRHVKRGQILALNLFFGWTVLGWVGSMIWALANPTAPIGPRHLQETFR
jgi:hypothetical protein